MNNSTLEEFLHENDITIEDWDSANIEWAVIRDIRADYEEYKPRLEEYAAMLARIIQKYEAVHSVRWRIKNTDNMLVKIIRKRHDKEPKYSDISAENYHCKITDLVGLRALHLFKNEAIVINEIVRSEFSLLEKPILYKRKGDTNSETLFSSEDFDHKDKDSGYRSIHYILEGKPQKRVIYAELQVRTIFEEGWSEIDHRLKYPNIKIDPTVEIFLNNFNRLAGLADEMGSFARDLAMSTSRSALELITSRSNERESFEKAQKLLAEVADKTQENEEVKAALNKLRTELTSMETASTVRVKPSHEEFRVDLTANAVENLRRALEQSVSKPLTLSTAAELRKYYASLLGFGRSPSNRSLIEDLNEKLNYAKLNKNKLTIETKAKRKKKDLDEK